MKTTIIICAACAGLLTGCVGNPLKDLKEDPAQIYIEVNSPWGLQKFSRTMPTNWTPKPQFIYLTNYVPVQLPEKK